MNTPAVKPGFSLGRLIVALIGLSLLVAGMALGANAWYFGRDAETAIGTVVSVAYEGSDGQSLRPTLFFKDSAGKRHVAQTNIASSSYNFAIGDEVPILFNFRVDEDVRIEGWLNNWGTGAVIGFIGLFLISRARRRVASRATAVAAPGNPWVAQADPESKQALIAAIVQSAGTGIVPGSAKMAKALARVQSASQVRRSAPTPKPRGEPTVRRMR